MKLDQGGHLTHGMKLNFSGRLYEVHAYGVRQDTERIDYDALEAQAREVRPKMIVAGASAYPRIIDFERMAAIAHGVGALLFVDMAHIAGLVAAGVHPSPFPHADIVTTTTHKTLRGPRGGLIFSRRELPPEVDPADFPNVKGSLAATVDKTVFPGVQGGPLMHVIAGKAVAFRIAASEEFRRDQRRTVENAATIADTLAGRGARLVSGGTDNHLVLVDVTLARCDRGARRRRCSTRSGSPSTRTRSRSTPQPAEHLVRDPGRHAGGDDTWHGSGRDARRSAT